MSGLFVSTVILFCFLVVDRKAVLSISAVSRLWHNRYTIKLHLHSIFYNFTIFFRVLIVSPNVFILTRLLCRRLPAEYYFLLYSVKKILFVQHGSLFFYRIHVDYHMACNVRGKAV